MPIFPAATQRRPGARIRASGPAPFTPDIQMMRNLIAAVDLGSNSFRLQVGRIVNDQIYPLDGLKESVRLAAGLSRKKSSTSPHSSAA